MSKPLKPEDAHTMLRNTIDALGGPETVQNMLDQFRRTMARQPLPRAVIMLALAEQLTLDPHGKDAVLSFLESAIDHFDCFFEDAPATEIPLHRNQKPD